MKGWPVVTSHNGKLIQLVFHSAIFQVKGKAELMKSARLEGRYEESVRVEGIQSTLQEYQRNVASEKQKGNDCKT
jgi:hypothetical protein